MSDLPGRKSFPTRPWSLPWWVRLYGVLFAVFAVLGAWLVVDLQREYKKVVDDRLHRAMQRSQIIGQTFRTKVLATDYVLRDVIGRVQARDLVHPDPDQGHAQRMTTLLKEKADTVPDFFSMVLFDRDCVFTATPSGKNTGVRSKPELCEARKMHRGPGPLTSYVPGTHSASGRSVFVLSRHLTSPKGEFQGGVMGVIELERAQHWLDSMGLDANDSVALLDETQVLLARYPSLPERTEKQVAGPATPAALASGVGVAIHPDIDGRERLFGFSQIEGFPFIIAYGFDQTLVIKEWKRRAMELTAGYFVLLVLALLVARSLRITLRQREALGKNNALLRASEEHFRMLAENMADIVWRADAQLYVTYINGADQRLRGFLREDVVGAPFQDAFTSQGQAMLKEVSKNRREIESLGQKGVALKYELPMRHKDGREVWVEISSVPIYDSDGRVCGYQGVGRDVSGRRRQEAQLLQAHQQLESQLREVAQEKSALQELATRDPLTGLYNRRFLDDTFTRELARSGREGKPVAVIMLDLDHFKAVNDQYSHAAGDAVLKALAELLQNGARESDLICRYGGEEFVAIMPNMSADQAWDRVESWRKQLEAMEVVYEGFRINITLSAGIAVFPDHGLAGDVLLTRADEMLYQSKQEGRNRISVYKSR